MKKQILAIIFLLASLLSTSVQAEQKNGWYFGANIGLSHFNPFKYLHKNKKNIKQEDINEENIKEEDIEEALEYFSKRDKPSIPIIGFFLGYEFNPYLGLELKNTSNSFFPHKEFKKIMNFVQPNTLELTTKLAYPVTDGFNLYTKLGGTIFWDELISKHHLKQMFTKQTSLYPTVALGAEYVFNKKLITRLDYTWKNKVEKIMDSSIKPSLGNLTFSLGWKFGAPHIRNLFPSYNESFLDEEYGSMLRENINFPFNSANLKPISCDKLNKLNEDIKRAKFENISIVLSGHADRIGNTEYNQKLSEDRAYSIKNYLTSKGFSRDKITVQGMGDLYPLTNQVCKGIKNRSLLISCLAPDRRVEIEVSSNSE